MRKHKGASTKLRLGGGAKRTCAACLKSYHRRHLTVQWYFTPPNVWVQRIVAVGAGREHDGCAGLREVKYARSDQQNWSLKATYIRPIATKNG